MTTAVEQLLGPELWAEVTTDRTKFKLACRKFPSLFIDYVLNVTSAACHVRMQQFLDEHPDCLVKAHRGLGKSSQITVGRVAWEIGKNPNLRVKIVSNVAPEAQKATGALMRLLESTRYQQIFPGVRRDKAEWGVRKLTVERKSKGMKDPTIEACHVFGHAGGRVDLLVFDDICDLDNAIRQDLRRNQVKDAVTNTWIPMTFAVTSPRIWRIGTPYHVDDVVAEWTRQAELEELPMLELKCDGVESSPWPEMFPPEMLKRERGRMGAIAYARAMELVPLSGDETVFRDEDLSSRFGRPPSSRRIVRRIAAMDLAFSERTASAKKKRDDRDWSVFAVGDVDSEGHVWVIRMVRARVSSPKWRDMVLKECDTYHPEFVITEEYGPLKGVIQEYREFFGNKGVTIRTRPPGEKIDKYARATACQSFVEGGFFHLRSADDGELQRDLRPMYDEMCEFPLGSHDDCADVALDLIEQAKLTIFVKGEGPKAEVHLPNMLCYADLRKRKEEREEEAKDYAKQYAYHGDDWDDEEAMTIGGEYL